MPDDTVEMHGVRVLVVAEDGPSLAGERAAADLVGAALERGARWVAVPTGPSRGGFSPPSDLQGL